MRCAGHGVGVARAGPRPAGAVLVGAALAFLLAGVLPAMAGAAPEGIARSSPQVSSSTVSVRVVGNELVNGQGDPIRLLGVDRSGTEYACIQGWGIFDEPSDASSVAAIASWHVNAVRVPLNEDCWLGINGVDPAYAGANYQSAIEAYVTTLNAAGMIAILDLHWNAPGTEPATGQQVMADADHSPAFWTSVATAFEDDPGVVFDLYNEPNGISWSCWLNGCTAPGGWQTAGMQSLVDAVRATGATQPIMVGGLNWAGDLSSWLQYEPVDPDHQLVASVHIYNFSECNTAACWNQTIAPVAAQVPVVTGELGENDCAQAFVDSYMAWADAAGVSYLGWTWDAGGGWTCSGGPALITDYDGTPTPYGLGLQTHLAALASGGGEAQVAVTPAGLSFGAVDEGSLSPPQAITVSDPGTGSLEVSSVTLGGADPSQYQVTTDTCTAAPVAAGSSCQVGVAFDPNENGSRDATLVLADNARRATVTVHLSGRGVRPPPGSVTVTYTVVDQWTGGLQGQLAIDDLGTAALGTATDPWTLQFSLPASMSLDSLWDGVVASSTGGGTTSYLVTGPSWETSIGPGQTWDVGYVVGGGTAAPVGCRVDGVACAIST